MQDGFTLIELLVVILIIAILMAVAAPTFLGQIEKARDIKTKAALNYAYKEITGQAIFNDNCYGTDKNDVATKLGGTPVNSLDAVGEGGFYVYSPTNCKDLTLLLRQDEDSIWQLQVVNKGQVVYEKLDA